MISDPPLKDKLLLGRYRVVHRLGEGGMGTVFLARTEGAEGFTRPVVVKRMRSEIRNLNDGARLFRREAEILSRLKHPNILSIVDFGVEEGAYLMVLDYVHGYSLMPWLDYRCKQERLLPVDVCLYIARRVLAALDYAHHFVDPQGKSMEIVHRDVSPDNILLSQQGHVHLLDFGVASIRGETAHNSTQSGTFRGKLGYAAPETLDGTRATARSDQYSAGIVLLELLTFDMPFIADTAASSVFKMLNDEPRPASAFRADIPQGLDEVVGRAIRKNPEERYTSVKEFSRELRRLQRVEDEEAQQLLAAALREDFVAMSEALGIEPLSVREEALSRPTTDSEADATSRRELENHATLLDSEAVVDAAKSSARTLLLKVAAAAGSLGILLGLVVWLAKGLGDQQVIVVGGDNSAPSGASSAATQPTAPPSASAVEPASDKENLGAALQQQSAAIEACFAKHLAAGQDPPEVFLHFEVPRAGGHAKVTVSPAAVAGQPLGRCLAEAGRQIAFPRLEADVSFRVPVRARVSRWNDGK